MHILSHAHALNEINSGSQEALPNARKALALTHPILPPAMEVFLRQVSLDLLDDKASFNENIERQEISALVRTRMQDLGLPVQDYDEVSDKRHSLSYVIINPNCDLPLEEGDIIFLIRPSPISSKRIFLKHGSVRIKTPRTSCRDNSRGGGRSKTSSFRLNFSSQKSESVPCQENGGLTPPQQQDPSSQLECSVHVTAATPSSTSRGTIV